MRRWIPKVGETVTLKGDNESVESWTGEVLTVSKLGCNKGTVRLLLRDKGWTTATAEEITIHITNREHNK